MIKMKIPVIILNYNSSSDCRKCISFLKKQDGVELEIVVVDNASPRSGERETLEELCKQEGCTYIESEENKGYNAGNNVGLRYAAKKGYKYALIANPDMEFPQRNYIEMIISKMDEDKKIAVCASNIVTPEGKHQNPMRESNYYEDIFWPITILRNRKKKKWFLMDYEKSGYCEKVSGCCFMIRISFIQEIGYLDEHVFLYAEEPILAKQVTNNSYKIYYLSEIQAIHRHIKSEKERVNSRMQQFLVSRNYYLTNYSGYSRIKLTALKISKFAEKLFLKIFIK